MAKVITFSTTFPAYHPKAGQSTWFPEKIWKSLYDTTSFTYMGEYERKYNDYFPVQGLCEENIHNHHPKHHTIRSGNRFKAGDYFSPRVWSGKPYNSKQLIIAPDTEIKQVFDFCIDPLGGEYRMNGRELSFETMQAIARNDGFSHLDDFELWFNIKRSSPGFVGQIICWNADVRY